MSNHKKAYDLLNDAVELLASDTTEEITYRLLVVCRNFLSQLNNDDFCEGLALNFTLLSKKLKLEDDFDAFLAGLDDAEASNLAKAICMFRNQVCEEHFVPGTY